MSKKRNDSPEMLGNTTMLVILFTNLGVLLSAILLIFDDQWNEYIENTLTILKMILLFIAVWFGFKLMRISNIVKSNDKLLKQLGDERVLEIDFRSSARGFFGCLFFSVFYIIISLVQKFLFGNNFLFEINGFYITLMTMSVGGIVYSVTSLYLDKE